MKYLIILADGMADEPIEAFGSRTPLQYISTPSMDRLAAMGRCGLFKSVPDGFHP
ncbi:MAG: phosphoglycerate mutase, partial [Bacteroidales bacterium]